MDTDPPGPGAGDAPGADDAYRPDYPEIALYKVLADTLLEVDYYREDVDRLRELVRRYEQVAERDPEILISAWLQGRDMSDDADPAAGETDQRTAPDDGADERAAEPGPDGADGAGATGDDEPDQAGETGSDPSGPGENGAGGAEGPDVDGDADIDVPEDADLVARVAAVDERLAGDVEALAEETSALESEVEGLRSELDDREERVEELERAVEERDERIAELEDALAARGDQVEDLSEEVESLEAVVESRDDRIEELEDSLKRTKAEFQNYKKRRKRQEEELRERATEDLVERLVDVRDNLVRALEDESGDAEALREGVEMTLREFDRVLDDEGVDEIAPDPGAEVDPQRHEVMIRTESDQPEDTIAEVYQPGYEMGEKVLRSARVTVSEGPPDGAGGAPADDDGDAEGDDANDAPADAGAAEEGGPETGEEPADDADVADDDGADAEDGDGPADGAGDAGTDG